MSAGISAPTFQQQLVLLTVRFAKLRVLVNVRGIRRRRHATRASRQQSAYRRSSASHNTVKQVREIRSGGSFLSQNDLRAYFGLGDYAGPVDVEVRMPGGRRWEWKQLPTDRLQLLNPSESRLPTVEPPR